MILECAKGSCKSDYQDKKYGKNKRVHNPVNQGDAKMGRCTICGTERAASNSAEKKGK